MVLSFGTPPDPTIGLRDLDLGVTVNDQTEYYLGNGPSLVVLLVLNAAAFLIGVSFYVHSGPALPDLSTFLYPFFGDPSAAPALMTLSTATLLPNLGRRVTDALVNRSLTYLRILTFVQLVKYGVWMVVVLNLRPDLYVGFSGAVLWDYWGIMLTHAGFLALTLAVPRYGMTTKDAFGLALTLALVNDVLDYGLGYYPPLKYEAGALPAGIAVALSFLAMFLVSRVFDCLPDVMGTTRERLVSHSR